MSHFVNSGNRRRRTYMQIIIRARQAGRVEKNLLKAMVRNRLTSYRMAEQKLNKRILPAIRSRTDEQSKCMKAGAGVL